jgi:NAD(P)-dependent dehydrogenase (short-subunit alcohol dehydrogenase family)
MKRLKAVAPGRYGERKGIGAAIAFLVRDGEQYITGNPLIVGGGQST